MSRKGESKGDAVALAEEAVAPEDYLREHAERLRAYAQYTSAKASMRLMESALLLEQEAERARDRRLAEAKRRAMRR